MPDNKQELGDAKRTVTDKTTPSSDTNTERTRTPGVPAPQKGGPDAPSSTPPSKSTGKE